MHSKIFNAIFYKDIALIILVFLESLGKIRLSTKQLAKERLILNLERPIIYQKSMRSNIISFITIDCNHIPIIIALGNSPTQYRKLIKAFFNTDILYFFVTN